MGKKEQIIGFFTTYSEEAGGNTHVTSHFATELVNLVVNAAQKRGFKTLVDITPKEDDFSEVEKYLNSGLIRGGDSFRLCERKPEPGISVKERGSPGTHQSGGDSGSA